MSAMKSSKSRVIVFVILFFLLLPGMKYISAQPNSGNEEEMLALQYFNDSDYEKAVVLYEKLYKKNPTIYLYGYYFDCLLALHEYDKAEKLVSSLSKKNPDVFRYNVDLGLIHQAKGDQKKAEKSFQAAIDGLRISEENFSGLAQYFMFKYKNDWAIRTYEKGIEAIPGSVSLRYSLSFLYFHSNRFDDMFELIYQLMESPMVTMNDAQQRLQAYFSQDNSKTIAPAFVLFALKKSQKNAQNTEYSEMLLWAYIQTSDYGKAMNLAIAMDRRQKTDGEIVIEMVPVLMANKEYDLLIQGLKFVIDKGEKSVNYELARISMFAVRYAKAIYSVPVDFDQLMILEKEIVQVLSEADLNINSVSLMEELASLQAFYLDKPVDARNWISKAMSIPRISPLKMAELKILMADIMILTGEQWDASLLYSQVEKDFKHDTIGYKAKFKNAQFYYYIGEFQYALTHLSVLRAATSKLIANDAMELSLFISNNIGYDSSYVPLEYYSRADFLNKCKKPLQAIQTLDSLVYLYSGHPVLDDAYMLRAQIFIDMEQYRKAADNLELILSGYSHDLLADDALFILAGLYANHLGDIDKAMDLYWTLLNDFSSSVYAQESRDFYRQLRDLKPTP